MPACPGQHPTRPRPPAISPRPLRVQILFSRQRPRPLRPTTQLGHKLLPRPRPPNLADLWQAKPRVVENARKFRHRRFPSLSRQLPRAVNRLAAAFPPLLSDGPFCKGNSWAAGCRFSLARIGLLSPSCKGWSPGSCPRSQVLRGDRFPAVPDFQLAPSLGLPRWAGGRGAPARAGTAGEPARGSRAQLARNRSVLG